MMDEEIYIPTTEELWHAINAFVLAVCVVAFHRGREFGPQRFSYVARQLGHEFSERFGIADAETLLIDFEGDSPSALGALYEEMICIATRYRSLGEAAGIEYTIPGGANHFMDETGNVFSDDDIRDIGTVKGSIDRLMHRLPRWAQRLLEAIMEALKLTRGG